MDRRRIAVLLAGAAAFINLYAPQSLLPLLRDWMGSSAALAGLVISATTAGVACAAPVVGWFADRLGRRRVIVGAAFLAILPTVLMGLAHTPGQLIAARFVEGLTLPGVFTVTVAYIGYEWPPVQARSVTALYVAGTIGGGFLGRAVAGVVGEFGGWRLGFDALTLVQLVLALAILAWLPAEKPTAPRAVRGGHPLMLLRNPRLRAAYACGPVILFALVGGFTYVTLHLAGAPFHMGPAGLSALFAVYLVGMLATPVAGRLLNALGAPRTLALVWGTAIAGLLLTLVPSLFAIVVGLSLFSVGLFFAQTTITNVVGEAAPASRGAAIGLYSSFYYLGGSVGGVLPAAAWAHAGWPGVVMMITAAGLGTVAIAWLSFGDDAPPEPRAVLADCK